ncbi:MAG: DUF308 domain-containing protein [Candidatus Gastranaerophilales bacterium]|nr:DUF308 domain-containing protein [Candidatus Gastranaerophilales bacterium]MCM1073473.1 DUF308 domain-containing protein [Bacteroides sp.]
MTEKRFLNFVLIEGILLSVLGICMLILPKVTSITFGLMICIGLIVYGFYKIAHAIVTRNYERHFVLNIVIGAVLAALGIVLLSVPHINLLIITSLIGIYFVVESISNTAFAVQTRKNMSMWWVILLIAILQFLLGLIIIIGLPGTSLWVVGMFLGINFLVAGIGLIAFRLSNKYDYNT